MARLNSVKSAQKPQGNCGKCGDSIERGDGYRWWKNFRAGKRVRCAKDECHPRGSEMAGSDKVGRLLAVEEDISDFLMNWSCESADDLETLADVVRDGAESAREVQDEYEEALEAWEHGNEQLQERAEAVEAWVGELEGAADDIENFDIGMVECGECAGQGVKVDDDDEPLEPEEECETCEGKCEVPDLTDVTEEAGALAEGVAGNVP